MKIFINGVEETQSYEGETLGEILQHIKERKVLEGTFISAVKLNDREMDVDSREALQTPLPKIDSLKIEIASLSALIAQNIVNAEEYLKKLIPGIQKASELFHSGNDQEANKFFLKIIDGIDWLSQVVDTVIHAMGENADSLRFNERSVLERKNQLIDLTSQMLAANKNRDWVLLADLLEYEILPFYKEWQTFLPQLRQTGLEKIN